MKIFELHGSSGKRFLWDPETVLLLKPDECISPAERRQSRRPCFSQNSSPRPGRLPLSRPQFCILLFIPHSSQSCIEFEFFPYTMLPPADFMVSIAVEDD